jgi:kynurenine formamidase
MESQNSTFDVFSVSTQTSVILSFSRLINHIQLRSITVDELDAVVEWQGMNTSSFHPGDFLVVRTGFTKQYAALPPHEQMILPYREGENATFLGVEASDKTLEWIWEKKISLVGADNPSFEMFPINGTVDGVSRSLHEVFLSGWGQSIGTLISRPSRNWRTKIVLRIIYLTLQWNYST